MLHSAVLTPLMRWDGGDSDSTNHDRHDPDQNAFWSKWNVDSSGYDSWSQLILLSSGLTDVGSVDSLGRKATWMRVCFDWILLLFLSFSNSTCSNATDAIPLSVASCLLWITFHAWHHFSTIEVLESRIFCKHHFIKWYNALCHGKCSRCFPCPSEWELDC